MGIKQFFNKSARDISNSFSKRNLNVAMRKGGNTLNQISPYLSDASKAIGGAAGIASVVPGIGTGVALGLGGVSAGLGGLSNISSGVGNLAKRQYEVNQRNKSRIEAIKPAVINEQPLFTD
jgi:hypothetical protein